MSQVKWNCLGCKALLGYVEDKKTVRIKRKDLYVEFIVKGGQVKVICPRCGKPAILEDSPDAENPI